MTGARRSGGGGWARLGMCSVGWVNVFSFGADVSSFRANVSSSWPNVFSFEGDVSTLAGDVSSFWWGALIGDGGADGRRDSFLRQAQDRPLRQAQDRLRQAQGRFFGDAGMTGEVASDWWVVGSGS